MLTVEEARRLVLQNCRPKSAVPAAASYSVGLILAEDVASDIDSPPFDKAMVDGYALRSADLVDGLGELEVIEEIIAGATSQQSGAPGQCWRIMTGAPIPADADAVVMHEHTQFVEHEARPERGEFTLDTFRQMLMQTRRLGPMGKVLGMIPGMSALKDAMGSADVDEEMNHLFGIIDAMTPDERRNPINLIDPIRLERIATGAGVRPKDVTDLVRQFDGMTRLMKEMAAMGIRERMKRMQELQRKPGETPTETSRDVRLVFGRLGRVRIEEPRFRTGQNIMWQGTSLRCGDTVLSAGREIRPVEIGLLAEVGRTDVSVIERPTVAILSTGNELVPPDHVPTAGQIRNSNGPMLTAAIRAAGARSIELGIARDEPAALRAALAEGLKSDVLVISGGVSAGALDLVPGLLKELGVVEVFHKIRLKPGKPLWFGVRDASSLAPRPSSLAPTLVFGLPGNPVSSLVCFELFVRPALARLSGREVTEELATTPARLTADFVHRGDRPTFHPAILSTGREAPTITPLLWSGSADLRGLSAANALAIFPSGDHEYTAGDTIESLPLRP